MSKRTFVINLKLNIMKSRKMKTIVIMALAIMMIGGTSTFAQRGQGMRQGVGQGNANYGGVCTGLGLDLTEAQQSQMNEMRVAYMKDVQPVRDQLLELKAHQRTLMNAEGADQKAINKNIDEMTKLENKLMKQGSEFQLKVKSILTDEQKVMMQSRQGRFGNYGQGMNRGRGAGMMNNNRRSGFNKSGFRGNGPNWNYNNINE